MNLFHLLTLGFFLTATLPIRKGGNIVNVEEHTILQAMSHSMLYIPNVYEGNHYTTFSYDCDDNRCYFEEALFNIAQSTKIQNAGLEEISHAMLTVIDHNQERFGAREMSGFVFTARGASKVFIENTSAQGNYVGVVEMIQILHVITTA